MKRWILHVPTEDNDGNELADLSLTVEAVLDEAGYGFTRTNGLGGWQGYRDGMYLYAIDTDDEGAQMRLEALARYVLETANQEAVYLTSQDIDVHMIERQPHPELV